MIIFLACAIILIIMGCVYFGVYYMSKDMTQEEVDDIIANLYRQDNNKFDL